MSGEAEHWYLPDQLIELSAASRNGGISITGHVEIGDKMILAHCGRARSTFQF